MTATASTKATMTVMTAMPTASMTMTLTWATVAAVAVAVAMMVLATKIMASMTAKRWAEAKIETGIVMTLPMWAMTKGAMIADGPMVD